MPLLNRLALGACCLVLCDVLLGQSTAVSEVQFCGMHQMQDRLFELHPEARMQAEQAKRLLEFQTEQGILAGQREDLLIIPPDALGTRFAIEILPDAFANFDGLDGLGVQFDIQALDADARAWVFGTETVQFNDVDEEFYISTTSGIASLDPEAEIQLGWSDEDWLVFEDHADSLFGNFGVAGSFDQ